MTNAITQIGAKLLPAIHPGEAYRQALEQMTPQDFWGKANSYSNPLGPKAGSAWILMLRSDLNKLDATAWHPIYFSSANITMTLTSMTIVRSLVMNRAVAADPNAAVLVEFQDVRRIARTSSINSQYNVRIPAPSATSGDTRYYDESLNSSAAWTWQTMLDDIWGNLPSASTAPTLPYTPNGTPEGFRFIGVSAWDAYHEVLEKIGCTTSLNPTTLVTHIIRKGSTQLDVTGQTLAARLAKLNSLLMYNYDSQTNYHLANMPKTIRVFFQRKTLYYGVELDTPDAGNWEMSPAVSKDYSTGYTGAASGTVLTVWDDLPAEHDTSGTNTNSAALQTRANEIGLNIASDLYDPRFRRMYSGIHNAILPGAQISEVIHRDYGDEIGMVTEYIRTPGETDWPGAINTEKFSPPDLVRSTHPLYPHVCQVVKATSATKETGADAQTFPGIVQRYTDAAGWEDLDPCWIYFAETTPTVAVDERFVGRLFGNQTETTSPATRPVYTVGNSGGGGNWIIEAEGADPFTITTGDTLDVVASGQSHSAEAHGTTATRGIVVVTSCVDEDNKQLAIAIDKSPLQSIVLNGDATAGTTPVLVRNGLRNSIQLDASASTSPVTLTGTSDSPGGDSKIAFTATSPFHKILGDSGQEDLNFAENLTITSDRKSVDVTKPGGVGTTVIANLQNPFNLGMVIMSYKKPVLDGTKYYMDKTGAGVADTQWALMDGASNDTPGSTIKLGTRTGTAESWFVRPHHSGTADADNTVYGRAVNSGDVDNDEVLLSSADHVDHYHQIATVTCDANTTGSDSTDFNLTGANITTIKTGKQITSGFGALTLIHTITAANGQGTTGVVGPPDTSAADIEMTPPNKKLFYYECVAVT